MHCDDERCDAAADIVEKLMARLGYGGGPRFRSPEWNASAAEGVRREDERRTAYLRAHPDAPRFPDETG